MRARTHTRRAFGNTT